jgi:translocation and assembly module TamB
LKRVVWVFVGVLLLLVGVLTGVLFSNTVLVWTLKAVPNVQVRGLQGNIAQGFEFDALIWQGKNADGVTQQVMVKQFRFSPDWSALKTRTLQVDALSATEVRVTWPSEANAPPPVLPEAVDLPLGLDLKQLRVGALVVNGAPLQNIQGQAQVENRQLVVRRLSFAQAESVLDANMTMTLQRPYALLGRVQVQRDQAPLRLEGVVHLKGSLEQLHLLIEAKASQTEGGGAQTLNVDTVLTPFAPELLEQLSLQAEGFNPKDWIEAAPKAKLSIRAQVQPAEQFSKATGRIEVRNAMPMSIQQGGLPLRSAALGLMARLDKQQLVSLDLDVESLAFAQGTEAAGDMLARLTWKANKAEKVPASFVQRLMDGQTHVHLVLHQLKPAVFGPAPKAMVLNGEVQAQQQGAMVHVTRVQLEDRGARLEGQGQGRLNQQQEMQAQLEFSHVNPAAYANKPSPSLQGDLNGHAKVSGSLKNLDGLIDLGFDHSSVAKTPFILDARIQGNPKRVNALNIHADVLGNTVQAQGAYGQPGDALNVQVNMPKLAALGALLQQQWAGMLALNAKLTGQGWGVSGQGDAKVRDLQLGQTLAVKSLDAQFNVGNQADSPWEARVEAKGIATPREREAGWVDVLNARLQGKRQQHTLSVDVQGEQNPFSRRRALKGAFAVMGGLSTSHDKVNDWSWRGQLDALKVEGLWAPMRSLTLLAPARLQLAPHRVELGAFELKGEDNTRIQNQIFRMAGADVQIQGKAPVLPVPRLSTLLKTPVSLEPKDLVLGADWNYIASAKGLDGRLNVFHVSGGLQVLEDLQMDVPLQGFNAKLELTRQSAKVDMKVDAKDFGNVVANMTLPIVQNPNTHAWGLASQQPMNGSMGASFSKLNWVGPLINGGLRTKGSGQVSVAIGGTLNAPDVQGRVFGGVSVGPRGAFGGGAGDCGFQRRPSQDSHFRFFGTQPIVTPQAPRRVVALAQRGRQIERPG